MLRKIVCLIGIAMMSLVSVGSAQLKTVETNVDSVIAVLPKPLPKECFRLVTVFQEAGKPIEVHVGRLMDKGESFAFMHDDSTHEFWKFDLTSVLLSHHFPALSSSGLTTAPTPAQANSQESKYPLSNLNAEVTFVHFLNGAVQVRYAYKNKKALSFKYYYIEGTFKNQEVALRFLTETINQMVHWGAVVFHGIIPQEQ